MGLKDIIEVNVGNPPARDDGHLGEWHELTFDVYKTVAFERDIMERYIGFGDAVFDSRGEFHGFDARSNPGMLNVGVWLAMVPRAYRDQAEHGAMYPVWDRFLRRKATPTILAEYVEALREWISTHIAPTDDPRPIRERFASALAEVFVRAVYDRREITREQARQLMDELRV